MDVRFAEKNHKIKKCTGRINTNFMIVMVWRKDGGCD
jgi:hypothetical protein